MSTLQQHLTDRLVRWMIGKYIFCPVSGSVLDVRSAVQFWRDDDLVIVVSPEAYAKHGTALLRDPAGITVVNA